METFAWTPDEAFVVSERGLTETSVEFGGGYRQVSYRGITRSWRVIFRSQKDEKLPVIHDFVTANKQFFWTQPSPHDLDGKHLTHVSMLRSNETHGRLTGLEYVFDIEVVGFRFAEEARQKHGTRDTGMIRDSK